MSIKIRQAQHREWLEDEKHKSELRKQEQKRKEEQIKRDAFEATNIQRKFYDIQSFRVLLNQCDKLNRIYDKVFDYTDLTSKVSVELNKLLTDFDQMAQKFTPSSLHNKIEKFYNSSNYIQLSVASKQVDLNDKYSIASELEEIQDRRLNILANMENEKMNAKKYYQMNLDILKLDGIDSSASYKKAFTNFSSFVKFFNRESTNKIIKIMQDFTSKIEKDAKELQRYQIRLKKIIQII